MSCNRNNRGTSCSTCSRRDQCTGFQSGFDAGFEAGRVNGFNAGFQAGFDAARNNSDDRNNGCGCRRDNICG